MALISHEKIAHGLFWVEIPEQNLRLMCGSPADAIKHLTLKGKVKHAPVDGFFAETGPNGIILSDLFAQKGQLSNLTEFPLLHMLYKQGLLIPGHPNQGGARPVLVGDPEQLKRQKEYFFRGNSGIVKEEEYEPFGVPLETAREWISIKKRFAYGHFPIADELFDCIEITRGKVELRPGVELTRLAVNVFEISYKGEAIEIDLNLEQGEQYGMSYELPEITLPDAKFAVVHTGEGDGWDPTRPCLSSLVIFDGKYYLIDAGPHIQTILKKLGLKPQDLSGVIMTHVHDDHFAGLYGLGSEKRGLAILASPYVYASMIHKFSSLLGLSLDEAVGWFHYEWLHPKAWNNVDGLEVYPFPSPHPLDTTLFQLRSKGPKGYKTYGHYADITSLGWLEKMTTPDENGCGITEEFRSSLQEVLLKPLDVKKVDVGGAPIHGNFKDFVGDKSKRLIFSHTTSPLNGEQLAIGEQASFGEVDILIP